MKHIIQDELLRCPQCGALLGLGRYAKLSRQGNFSGCTSDMIIVPAEESERMLAERRAATDGETKPAVDIGEKRE